MKHYLYKVCVLWMALTTGCFVACQEEDEDMQSSTSKGTINTHGELASRSVTCEVETHAGGQLLYKLDSIATIGNYSKEDITDLTIKGPVTREDLRILRPFQKMSRLDLTDITILDEWGNTSTHFPESVLDSLGSPAHVYLPTSITSMGWDGFRHSQITGVYMPDNIKEISSGIFFNCPNLTSVRLSEKLEALSWELFQDCPSLTTIEIPESVTVLQGYSLSGTGLKSFNIPENITVIEEGIFFNCKNLEKVVWSSPLTEIPRYCFYGCEKLEFEIPDYITVINDYAFAHCYALKEFIIPPSVKEIRYGAFQSCQGLTNIHIPATVETWGDAMFEGCTNLETVTGIENWTKIPYRMFNCCLKLNIEIPQQVVTIGDRAFERCYALQNPQLPSTLKVIEDGAFCDCYSITEMILPEGIDSIGAYAFQNIPITEITFPSSIKMVGVRPLQYCHQLKVVYWETAAEMPLLAAHSLPFVYAKAGIAYDKMNNNLSNLIFGDDETGYTTETFLLEDKDYYCPKSFTAQKVVFRRWYSNRNYMDGSPRAWQTISLPFTATKFVVQEYGEQPQRDLKPFGSSDMGDAKPFWLRSLHSDGFQRETVLEAGKPYIIAFPNSDQYLPEYNIEGTIEYWGENTVVMASTDALTPAVGPDFTMHATFNQMERSENIYTLEYREVYDENGSYQYWGQVWIPNWNNVNRFQAYATPNGTAARSYSMDNGSATSRSTKHIGVIPQESDID